MSTRLHIVVSDELLARIDGARGPGEPRAHFIRWAVEQAMMLRRPMGQVVAEATAAEQALGGPGNQPRESAGTQAPAPVEQPREYRGRLVEKVKPDWLPQVRSSSEARPFRPVPKKGER